MTRSTAAEARAERRRRRREGKKDPSRQSEEPDLEAAERAVKYDTTNLDESEEGLGDVSSDEGSEFGRLSAIPEGSEYDVEAGESSSSSEDEIENVLV